MAISLYNRERLIASGLDAGVGCPVVPRLDSVDPRLPGPGSQAGQ